MTVVRGPDWKWGDEDGGKGEIGTILAIDKRKQTITVGWRNTNHVGTQYRFAKGSADLALAPDDTAMEVAGLDRRNSQFMFSSQRQTVIIFDWDDTLFPTTYVRDDMELNYEQPMKDQQIDDMELNYEQPMKDQQ